MADEQGPWIDTSPGPRNADMRQRDSLFCRPCKMLRVFVGSKIFYKCHEPVKVCHIFHADIVQLCQMYRANVSIYTSKFNGVRSALP